METVKEYGPTVPFSQKIHQEKYRLEGESFYEAMCRIAGALAETEQHRQTLKDILLSQRFLPAGRIQAAVGTAKQVTPFNCFVSQVIEDDSLSIMEGAKNAFLTMRKGGGIGYDFSRIRPRGDFIASLNSKSSGPLSFMDIYDAVCATVLSAGHRRGAQMGVLRIDHPDIELFIKAKQNGQRLSNFNISVGVTDEFFRCLQAGSTFPLTFNGKIYKEVSAKYLWEELMRSNWDWAEPGVLFIDTINRENNLSYCEILESSNPCAEQPLPPNGACLLGSLNLVKYLQPLKWNASKWGYDFSFNYQQFSDDIHNIVPMMDNIIDDAIYPLEAQAEEAKNKRRMGLGITGLANTAEILGMPYASEKMLQFTQQIMRTLREDAYLASTVLAEKKGPFKLFDKEKYLESPFIKRLSPFVQSRIREVGIRNSHLISIAPTGTISISADNVSAGIEPPFALSYNRTVTDFDKQTDYLVEDYAAKFYGVKGRTSDEISAEEHVRVLTTVAPYVDSAVSKTCNIGDDVTWEEFKQVYVDAYEGGAKGCTTFRAAGKRYGVLNKVEENSVETSVGDDMVLMNEGSACYIDPDTGQRECS